MEHHSFTVRVFINPTFFTVLQVQHGVQHDARAAKAPPCVHSSSSFAVRLFINPPFFTVLQVQHGVQHDARAENALPCALGCSDFDFFSHFEV